MDTRGDIPFRDRPAFVAQHPGYDLPQQHLYPTQKCYQTTQQSPQESYLCGQYPSQQGQGQGSGNGNIRLSRNQLGYNHAHLTPALYSGGGWEQQMCMHQGEEQYMQYRMLQLQQRQLQLSQRQKLSQGYRGIEEGVQGGVEQPYRWLKLPPGIVQDFIQHPELYRSYCQSGETCFQQHLQLQSYLRDIKPKIRRTQNGEAKKAHLLKQDTQLLGSRQCSADSSQDLVQVQNNHGDSLPSIDELKKFAQDFGLLEQSPVQGVAPSVESEINALDQIVGQPQTVPHPQTAPAPAQTPDPPKTLQGCKNVGDSRGSSFWKDPLPGTDEVLRISELEKVKAQLAQNHNAVVPTQTVQRPSHAAATPQHAQYVHNNPVHHQFSQNKIIPQQISNINFLTDSNTDLNTQMMSPTEINQLLKARSMNMNMNMNMNPQNASNLVPVNTNAQNQSNFQYQQMADLNVGGQQPNLNYYPKAKMVPVGSGLQNQQHVQNAQQHAQYAQNVQQYVQNGQQHAPINVDARVQAMHALTQQNMVPVGDFQFTKQQNLIEQKQFVNGEQQVDMHAYKNSNTNMVPVNPNAHQPKLLNGQYPVQENIQNQKVQNLLDGNVQNQKVQNLLDGIIQNQKVQNLLDGQSNLVIKDSNTRSISPNGSTVINLNKNQLMYRQTSQSKLSPVLISSNNFNFEIGKTENQQNISTQNMNVNAQNVQMQQIQQINSGQNLNLNAQNAQNAQIYQFTPVPTPTLTPASAHVPVSTPTPPVAPNHGPQNVQVFKISQNQQKKQKVSIVKPKKKGAEGKIKSQSVLESCGLQRKKRMTKRDKQKGLIKLQQVEIAEDILLHVAQRLDSEIIESTQNGESDLLARLQSTLIKDNQERETKVQLKQQQQQTLYKQIEMRKSEVCQRKDLKQWLGDEDCPAYDKIFKEVVGKSPYKKYGQSVEVLNVQFELQLKAQQNVGDKRPRQSDDQIDNNNNNHNLTKQRKIGRKCKRQDTKTIEDLVRGSQSPLVDVNLSSVINAQTFSQLTQAERKCLANLLPQKDRHLLQNPTPDTLTQFFNCQQQLQNYMQHYNELQKEGWLERESGSSWPQIRRTGVRFSHCRKAQTVLQQVSNGVSKGDYLENIIDRQVLEKVRSGRFSMLEAVVGSYVETP